jgi:predicted RNA binding protein YcfA (HicA-like mRNA interferase family)
MAEDRAVVLRCYAVRRGEEVYAECIDLDIAVTRPTMDEAVKALTDAVFGHVAVAIEHDCVDELIHRPSPLSHRICYRFLVFITKVLNLFGTSAAVFDQVVPCSA